MTLLVNEIFHSIQGESLYGGRPCVFIRLTGCNLRCTYCDTIYAYDEGNRRDIDEIVEAVQTFGCPLVEITGGEPLLQPETPHLIDRLISAGHEVMIETNGSIDISPVSTDCTRIVDVKCPSSGASEYNRTENFSLLTCRDQLKFVIGDEADYDYARGMLSKLPTHFHHHHVLFSPVSDILPFHVLGEWILRDGLAVRLHLQLHKIIWPDVERGR
jgi:7-carboxy-7-deazaguanine synthase